MVQKLKQMPTNSVSSDTKRPIVILDKQSNEFYQTLYQEEIMYGAISNQNVKRSF
jgi:hypothetical protein